MTDAKYSVIIAYTSGNYSKIKGLNETDLSKFEKWLYSDIPVFSFSTAGSKTIYFKENISYVQIDEIN